MDAQEARRIFDRLYGYEVSPVLWKKIQRGLSAGRVQSVAIRIVVQRERERMAFRSAEYWDLGATFELSGDGTGTGPRSNGTLVRGRRQPGGQSGRDFNDLGAVTRADVVVLDEAATMVLRDAHRRSAGHGALGRTEALHPQAVRAVHHVQSLQVEAGRKLRFSSSQTMSVAQSLYQNGYITYMRTDSTTLSDTAVNAARTQIRERYGDAYLPDAPRQYSRKVKNAQEAHEAIRPAGDSFRTPDEVPGQSQQPRSSGLYELIWQRTIASQMTDARGESVAVRLGVTTTDGRDGVFAASGRTILFPGFLRAYVESRRRERRQRRLASRVLPDMLGGGRRLAPWSSRPRATRPSPRRATPRRR